MTNNDKAISANGMCVCVYLLGGGGSLTWHWTDQCWDDKC